MLGRRPTPLGSDSRAAGAITPSAKSKTQAVALSETRARSNVERAEELQRPIVVRWGRPVECRRLALHWPRPRAQRPPAHRELGPNN